MDLTNIEYTRHGDKLMPESTAILTGSGNLKKYFGEKLWLRHLKTKYLKQ